MGYGGATVKRSLLVPKVLGSIPGLGISEIYFSSPCSLLDFKLCLRIDDRVASIQVLEAVGRYESLTMRYTHTRQMGE
jgi:hypothetical protein